MQAFKKLHYYIIPLVCMVTWWGMLIAFLSAWSLQGEPIYPEMTQVHRLIYLSDIGATNLQPLFISCAGFQAIFFVGTLLMEIILRKQHKLQPYVTNAQFVIAILSLIAGCIGQLGIIFVSIFNTNEHHTVHLSMLGVFIAFCFIAIFLNLLNSFLFGIFTRRLTPEHKIFFGKNRFVNIYMIVCVIKAFWLATASSFALAFAMFMKKSESNSAAIFEWILCFWYGLILLIWSIDLFPAAIRYYTRNTPTNAMGDIPTNYPGRDATASETTDVNSTNEFKLSEDGQTFVRKQSMV